VRLLRIWVRSGAKITHSHPDFQGPEEAHRTPQNRGALREQHPYLRAKRFHFRL